VKTYSRFLESGLNDKMDKVVSDEIKKRKLARFPVNATDDYKMKKKKNLVFKFPTPSGELMFHVYLRKMAPSKGQPKGVMAFNYDIEDK
jgi:CRISPR/Cas system endoribonuclease Cas6 (RAMP superfamily)|tara:strand:- start:74 stop:340 length:267 start_codon:yes stop_codon:yes gene_type:complete